MESGETFYKKFACLPGVIFIRNTLIGCFV